MAQQSPLAIIDATMQHYTEGLKSREVLDNPERLSNHHAVIGALEAIRASMEIEYFPFGDETTLGALRPGAVFATEVKGYGIVYAFKTAHRTRYAKANNCYLLSTGGNIDFIEQDATVVCEVIQPQERKEE